MGQPHCVKRSDPRNGKAPGEVKHLSSRRKRNRRDPPSSGERNGDSLNLHTCKAATVVCGGVAGPSVCSLQRAATVTKEHSRRTVLGKRAAEGDSPVVERELTVEEETPSRSDHEEFRLNQGGPSSKAKHFR